MLFQSFSGRSCSQKVRHAFTTFFMKANAGVNVRYKKLMPSEIEGEESLLAPVTGLSFIKRRTSADKFDDYGPGDVPEEVDIEVHVHARKKGSWGPFGKLDEAALRKEASGLYLADAEQFDRAIASVKIGKKTRRFAIFGPKGEAGSIDVTEDLEFLSTGHPETSSLQKICNEIMSEFSGSL